jgi:hypothetical protein
MLLKLLLRFLGCQRQAPYSRAERQVEPRRRILLQGADDVGITVKRDGNRGVSEALLDHLRVDAFYQELSGVAVPQIMNRSRGKCGDRPIK